MEFRLAKSGDLQEIKTVYKEIVQHMNEQNIKIWDEVYPCEFFEDDIRNNQLYVLLEEGKIIAAFVICDKNNGETAIKWADNNKKAYYLDRLGVNKNYSKQGIGSLMIDKAKEIAKKLGAEYLRLFVVDINKPAIALYVKNGFKKADGIYDEVFADGFVLHEFGYEIKL